MNTSFYWHFNFLIDSRASSHKQQDSGKSSDSSISSAHGYRRLQEGSGGGGSLRIGNSHHQRKQHSVDNCYRMLQESSSSHNIPHVTIPGGTDIRHHQHYPHPTLSYSISNSSDLAGSGSPSHSNSTPLLKKKFGSTEQQPQQQHATSNRESCPSVSKHQSFDYTGSESLSLLLSYIWK